MKHALAALALLLALAAPAAAGTVQVNAVSRSTTAAQDQAWVARRDRHNAETCTAAGLAVGCTQAQVNAAGGSGTIYSGAGSTEAYFLDRVFELIAAVERQINDSRRAELNAKWNTATEAQRAAAFTAACSALGGSVDSAGVCR
jgi:hypothetical protein